MSTIPQGSYLAAQRYRQLHQKNAGLRQRAMSEPISMSSSACTSPICTPDSTPPASPRKLDYLLGLNPMTKINQLLNRPGSETEIGVSASGQTQSLEASHHTSSITSMT